LAQVVDWRSYSRTSGQMSEDSEMKRSGKAARTISAMRASCAGFA
jgi:hypothetical protein